MKTVEKKQLFKPCLLWWKVDFWGCFRAVLIQVQLRQWIVTKQSVFEVRIMFRLQETPG